MPTRVLMAWSATKEQNSSFESNATVVLDISDISTKISIFSPLRCYQVAMGTCEIDFS